MGDVEALAEQMCAWQGGRWDFVRLEVRERYMSHAAGVLASPWLAAHVAAARAEERELVVGEVRALDDDICGALMAAKHGSYDGRSVERHLERLLDKFRALLPDTREDLRPREGA